MAATKFKALMHNENFVDENQLNNGIIVAAVPKLRSVDHTIQTIREETSRFAQWSGMWKVGEAVIANLLKCELVEVEVKVIKPKPVEDEKQRT